MPPKEGPSEGAFEITLGCGENFAAAAKDQGHSVSYEARDK